MGSHDPDGGCGSQRAATASGLPVCATLQVWKVGMKTDGLSGLDWSAPGEEQIAARKVIASTIGNDLSPLLMQNLQKSQWANAAEILAGLETWKIARFASDLLAWLKDMNWPGAVRIFETLLKLEKHELRPKLDQAISMAHSQSDKDWLENLQLLQSKMSG